MTLWWTISPSVELCRLLVHPPLTTPQRFCRLLVHPPLSTPPNKTSLSIHKSKFQKVPTFAALGLFFKPLFSIADRFT
eukprot:g68750.t1